jgi:hypothetical protein
LTNVVRPGLYLPRESTGGVFMVSLVFHGGHYKTGTTSLQHALRASEEGLRAAGILYPRGFPDAQFNDVQHADLLNDCYSGRHDRVERYLTDTVEAARAQDCRTVLLSAELCTWFHEFPDAFARWSETTGRLFDDVRYLFVVRDMVGYASSSYRELAKSGRVSFHYDAVKGELLKQLCLQQRSIAFFRRWDSRRVTLLSFSTLAAGRLVHDLAQALVGYEIDPAIELFLNSSRKRARNLAGLLLNDIYALIGAQRGQEPLALAVRKAVHAGVDRGKLRKAFSGEFAAEVERAFLEVTEAHVRRLLEEERAAVVKSLEDMPDDARAWLTAEPPAVEAEAAEAK